jgi:CRP/FNR family transcriptional regulator, cyclic AMP receptor protein
MTVVTPGSARLRSLLDLDPDLASTIVDGEWERARRACKGPLVSTPAGTWALPSTVGDTGALLGLVIITGLVCREMGLRDRRVVELLGPGDVLQLPASQDSPHLGTGVTLTAAADTEMLALLWYLAQRWGVVTAAGIVLPLPLSHDLLGQMVGARRPTVSLAVAELQESGVINRLPDGSWLLTALAEGAVETISRTHAPARSLGELLATRLRISQTAAQSRTLRVEARLAGAPAGGQRPLLAETPRPGSDNAPASA